MVMLFKKVHSINLAGLCSSLLSLVGFLELINNMLTSGMVPALFADDEKDQIIGQVISLIHVTFYDYMYMYSTFCV